MCQPFIMAQGHLVRIVPNNLLIESLFFVDYNPQYIVTY